MKTRIESDSVGSLEVPVDAYYGVQSLRAKNNFPITGKVMHPELITSLAYIKKAAAMANANAGKLDTKIADAIIQACDEIIAGGLRDQFIVDAIQGGAGTSANMNANEVIANRAIEILGGQKGDYSIVHPNDHVNMAQSTNDVYPTAGKLTVLTLLPKTISSLSACMTPWKKRARNLTMLSKWDALSYRMLFLSVLVNRSMHLQTPSNGTSTVCIKLPKICAPSTWVVPQLVLRSM